MVHGKRTTLMPEDVEQAMEALNVEVCELAELA
jgi:histone H3/H4